MIKPKRIASLLVALCFVGFTTYSQSSQQTTTLHYKPATNINGLTPVAVDFTYKVVNVFGTMQVIYTAKCTGDLAYQYKGRTFTFTGSDAAVRKIVVKDPVINVIVTGPNGFKKEMRIGVISGISGGVLTANSSPIREAKTKEEKDPNNYTVTPLQVLSVSHDNSWDLQNELDAKMRDEQKQKDIDELKRNGDRAMLMQDYATAQSEYLKILRIDKSYQYAINQITKAKSELEKKSSKKKFDDLMSAGKTAESKGDLDDAERLYREAAYANSNNNAAQNDAARVKSLREKAKKDKDDQIKKLQDKIDEDQKKSKDLSQKKTLETKKVLEERQNEEQKLVKEKMDKLNDELAKEEKQKLEEKQKQYWKDKADEEERKEKAEKAEEKKNVELRKKRDDKTFVAIEKIMSYDGEQYYKNLKIAQSLLQKSFDIKPWEEMQLKKEWWDNNQYIQLFAEDLYEPQRKENHQRYMAKLSEEKASFYATKEAFIYAMRFVDKGSSQHDFLLERIEFCNKEIEFLDKMWLTDFKYEWNRPKLREQAKIVREAQVMSNNFDKAQLAYAALDKTAENQAENLTKKYALAQRMNDADLKYKQNVAVAGVTQSVVMSAIVNDDKSVAAVENGSIFNLSAFTGMASIPMLLNETSDNSTPKTEINSISVITAAGGFDFWIYKSKTIDFNIGGNIGIGLLPMQGISQFLFNYSGKANFDFGFKRFKIATTCEFINRTATQEIDYDVYQANSGSTASASNRIAVGNFNYSVLRLGGGFKIDFSDKEESSHLLFTLFAEKPSFYPESILSNPIFSYHLEFSSKSGFTMSVSYANNYAVAGEKKYNIPDAKNKDFFQLQMGKYWTIFK